ncbi:putative SLACS reverse transcriptase [Trypanosoma cruzi]|uniref:Putative SLACS reverse transcriptase n=1 Tax=Trypanosoma cruzi TaxID=5693 RepID=A0A2V2UFS1_TRYCR|nr:putative SLACS reverse transcriptase [Trypanosoma cruzi]
MAYSNRGMPMPFDFRNGRTDSDWTTGGKRQQPPRYMTRSSAASRTPFIHRDSVDPSQLQDIITAATTEAIKRLTSPTNGRYTDNNGNRSWRSRSGRPPRRDAEILWRSQPPQGGPQMMQGGNRSWQYRDQQPRRYRSQSSLERHNTTAQVPRRTQQEVRSGSQGVRRGASHEQRGPQSSTATPSFPGRREVAQGLPHAGFRGQLTRPKNPHAAIAALAELELQAYQEKHQRYIGATKTLVPWWTALYQSGAQNYHCPLCSFNRPGEHDVFYHCRQAHPTYDKCYPYRLHLNGHCTFPVEKSCSLNAVLAVLSHYEDESQLSQELRSTYTVPCRENTERIIRAMDVNLPLAPVSALELLIKNDSKLRRMFSTTAVAGTQCEVCGWALPMAEAYPSYSETLQDEPAVITLQPGKRAPIHLTQTLLMQQYRSTWISEEHVCAGEQLARHHPQWAMTATKSRKFDDAVALEFGHWDKQAMGVEEIPFVILLPHQNGTAEYGLVGLVATNAPNHVVAYIPSTLHKDTEWVMIDGMVQKVQRKPINTHKVILCLYRRRMPETGPEEDEEDDEHEPQARNREQDGRTLASAPKGSRRPKSQKWEEAPDDSSMVDGFGKNGYGQPPGSATHSSPPASSSPSTQTITQDPFLTPIAPRKRGRRGEDQEEESEGDGNKGEGIVCEEDEEGLLQPSVPPTSSQPYQQAPQVHFLDEEEEEITLRRTQPQEPPHTNKDETPPHQQSSLPQEAVEMEEEGVGGEEGESETPRHTTGQEDGGHPFSHDKTPALLDPVWCLAGGCHHKFSGPRRGEQLRSHIHAVHHKQERMDITNEALISQGLVRCDACGEVCSASLRARAAHRPRCGQYTCRKENMATQREEYRASVTGSHYTKTAAFLERTPAVEWPTTPATDPRQDPWLQERVPTRRYLHKREWPNWLDVCRTVMLGYNASAPEERSRKQVAIMDLVRQHLRLPENPRSRRQATRTNHDKQHTTDPPPDHYNATTVVRGAMETTKDGEESVSDETEQQDTTAHQPERILTASDIYKTRRVETLCTLQATGRAAALLTAAEAEPVVFSPELVQSLDDLYPQEDTSLYPEPAVSAPLVTFDSKDVAKIIGSRLTRGAAPGLDGWTRELLYPLTKDKALLMEITAILTDMANGNVAPEVAHRLRATNLTVLRKPNKKFRPIGAECVWAKAISLMAVDAVMPALKTCFKNLQYGVGNNIELAIQKIRRDFHLKGSVAMLDGRNAYNAISRTAILSAVYGNTAWSPLWRVTRLLLGTEGLVGFYEKGQLVHSWKSTRGVRQGMVLGPVLFSIGTIATLRQLESSFSNASFTAYLDDVTVAAPPGMLGKVCEATSRAMRALGIETNEDKTEVLNKGGPVDMPAEYIRPFARVLGAGVANDPESELITQFVQRKAEETDRLFRAIVELPFAKHTQWRLLSVSALPRVTFLLRTHAPAHTRAAAEWFDDRVTGVLGVIMDGPVTKRARDIAALPVRRGGCGLRRQREIAEFAYACLGEKGKQRAMTDELDAKHQSDLYETLQGPDRKVFVSNTAAGAGRPLTDPQVHADDRGFSTYLRERLLVRVLPEGQKCVCGADASNEHVHTCTRLQQNPRTTRHDMINMTFANGLRLCGFQCGMEPRLTEASRRRPDILIVGLDTYAITDVTVTYAGRVTAYVSEESMEEADPLRAARDRLTQKRQKYRHWALANGLDFEPFVMLTNGAIHPASRRWLRRILGNQDHRLTITNAYDMIVADTLAAMLRGNVHVFNAACGRAGTG